MTKNLSELTRSAATLLGLKLPKEVGVTESAFVLLNALEAIERARVVEVLDAWARIGHAISWATFVDIEFDDDSNVTKETWTIELSGLSGKYPVDTREFQGPTPDAARAAAAKAIEAGEV